MKWKGQQLNYPPWKKERGKGILQLFLSSSLAIKRKKICALVRRGRDSRRAFCVAHSNGGLKKEFREGEKAVFVRFRVRAARSIESVSKVGASGMRPLFSPFLWMGNFPSSFFLVCVTIWAEDLTKDPFFPSSLWMRRPECIRGLCAAAWRLRLFLRVEKEPKYFWEIYRGNSFR